MIIIHTFTIFRLLPLGGYVAFPTNVITDEQGEITGENPDPNLLQNRPPLQRALVISGGVLANVLLTFLLSTGVALTNGLPRQVFNEGILVTSRVINAPGMMAGIEVNDRILRINDYPIPASSTAVNEFVAKVRSTPENELVNLELLRPIPQTSASIKTNINTNIKQEKQEKLIKLQVKPEYISQGTVFVPYKHIICTIVINYIHILICNAYVCIGKATIGLGVASSVKETVILKGANIIDSARIGADETRNLLVTTFNGLKTAVSTGFAGADVGGPISVIKVGATVAAYDPYAIIGFASFLSINLAILNSLPLPALDG